MLKKFLKIVLTALLMLPVTIFSNPADLDTTFNSTGAHPGTTTTFVKPNNALGQFMSAAAVALQSDENIVVVGTGEIVGVSRMVIARVTSSGALDTSFGGTGAVAITIDPSEYASVGTSVAIQSDGKIVVGGNTATQSGVAQFSLVRLTTLGELDTTFNGTGIVSLTINSDESSSVCFGVAIQSDGKIVASGFTSAGEVAEVAALRLNSDGALDISFNETGIIATKINSNETGSRGASITVQPIDGKIVIAGITTLDERDEFGAIRFNTDGTIDTTFTTKISPEEISSQGASVTIDENAKIVIAGIVFFEGTNQCAVARFNSDGTLDTTFAATINPSETASTGASVVIQPADGKIVVAGEVDFGEISKFGVARFNADGTLDTTVTTTIDLTEVGGSSAASVALQSDGKIVVAGQVLYSGSNSNCAVARYDTHMALDATFNGTGTESLNLFFDNIEGSVDGAGVALEPNGSLIITGLATTGQAELTSVGVARFTKSGVLDASFNATGLLPGTFMTYIDSEGASSQGLAVVVQSDAKIVIAGKGTVGGSAKFGVVRLNFNGSLDTTFNAAGGIPGTIATPIVEGEDSSTGAAVAMQSDGKIVVAGSVTIAGVEKFAVARFNTDGTVDTTFTTKIDSNEDSSTGAAVAMQSDGKIVVAGSATIAGVEKFAVARFNTDGTVDTTFTTKIDSNEDSSTGAAVAIQPDGKIVVTGATILGGADRCAVARFNSNGTLDTTFNGTGTVSTQIHPTESQSGARALQLQSDGKIIIDGYVSIGTTIQFAVARFLQNGTLDVTFGTTGTTSTYIDTGELESYALAGILQSDGKIIAAGLTVSGQQHKIAAVRFVGSPIIPQSVSITSWLKTIYAEKLGFVP